MALNGRSAVAVLTGVVSTIASALYTFGYRISTVLSRVSKISVCVSPTARLHLTTHRSSSICRDSCDSAGRLCHAVGVVGHPFLGRHGLTEGKIMPPFQYWREMSAGTLFLLRWRMACRGTDACDPTCSAISPAALNISTHVVVSGSFLQPCNNSFTTASSSAAWMRSQFFCWSCFGRGSKGCIHVSAVHKAMKSNLSIACR